MANKRQQKKQQTKQNIKSLRTVGANKKEIKQLRNDTKTVKKKEFNYKRKIIAQERSTIIKSFGYKIKDYASLRYVSQAKWDAWYTKELKKKKRAEQKAARQLKNNTELFLTIYWKDKTSEGFADEDVIERFKYENKYMTSEALLQSINFYLRNKVPAEIGTAQVNVVRGDELKNNKSFMHFLSSNSAALSDMNNWLLVYEGKAKRYKELLIAINTIVQLLYDALERTNFINDLLTRKLPMVNINMAKRLANDLQWRSIL